MGRDAKSPDLKVLHGNPSKEPEKPATKSLTGAPKPPGDLKGEAFAEWCRVTAFLTKVGRVEAVDYAALVVYVSAWETFDLARQAMSDQGPLIQGRDGNLVRNPAAQIMRDSADTMLKFGAKFGVTPKDRQNLGIAGDPAGDEDELEKHLRIV